MPDPTPYILVIDDEASVLRSMRESLEHEGYKVDTAQDGKEGWEKFQDNWYDTICCDIKMPKIDGMELLDKVTETHPDLPFIIISAHGDIETAVQAVKKGAYDFIEKPVDLDRLLITVRNALDKSQLANENRVLKQKANKTREIIGQSPSIKKIKNTIERVAATDARVLITGENGTGKELVARWIHEKSQRANGHLIEVNCAAIPNELIESELFGHEKGAFTSAIKQHIGKFEQAHGGTLLLDEIGDMSLSAQAKVLKALENKTITRIGGDQKIKVDVRVIAATNKNINEEIKKDNFRLDLYHRLSVMLIHVPSLNERKEDIPLLAEQFLEEICQEYGIQKHFTADAMQALQQINWTGNVRELHNVVERLAILSDKKITAEEVETYAVPNQLPPSTTTNGNNADAIFDKFDRFHDFKDYIEKQFINKKLNDNNWNVSQTAKQLDIQRSHLYNKIEKYNLKRNET